MLKHQTFYHEILRKVTTVFGTLFNEIYIVRRNANDEEVERLKVPIAYGPKDKWVSRMVQDPDLNRQISIKTPRISFQITTLRYAGQRKRNKIKKHVSTIDGNSVNVVFDGVPYNIGFELNIIGKNQDDVNQVLEQILPYFTPDFTPSYNPLSQYDFKEDLVVNLDSVNYFDNYDESYATRRNVIYAINFSTYVFFYGPVKEQGIITKASVDTYVVPGQGPVTNDEIDQTPRHFRTTTTPDPINALPDSDFGYTEVFEEFDDNKKYDNSTGTDIDIDD